MRKGDEKPVIEKPVDNDAWSRFHEAIDMLETWNELWSRGERIDPTANREKAAKAVVLVLIGSHGSELAVDPLPRIKRTWSTEQEGLWTDWVSLSKDVSDVMASLPEIENEA